MDYVRSLTFSSMLSLHSVKMLMTEITDWRNHPHERYDFHGHNHDDGRGEG